MCYLIPLKVDLSDHLGPPVDSDQGVLVDPEADPRHAPPLQRRTPDVIQELELGVEHLDPAVAGVHHEDPVVHVQGEAAGLDEAVLPGAMAAVTQQRRVVSCHLEKHRTISDGAGKNEHLERRTHVSKSRKRCDYHFTFKQYVPTLTGVNLISYEPLSRSEGSVSVSLFDS